MWNEALLLACVLLKVHHVDLAKCGMKPCCSPVYFWKYIMWTSTHTSWIKLWWTCLYVTTSFKTCVVTEECLSPRPSQDTTEKCPLRNGLFIEDPAASFFQVCLHRPFSLHYNSYADQAGPPVQGRTRDRRSLLNTLFVTVLSFYNAHSRVSLGIKLWWTCLYVTTSFKTCYVAEECLSPRPSQDTTEKCLRELASVFTPELALAAYIPLCRIFGRCVIVFVFIAKVVAVIWKTWLNCEML